MQKITTLSFILLLIVGLLYADLGDAAVSVSSHSLQMNENVEVEISTSELLSDWNVTAYQFQFHYDADLLEYSGLILDGTLSEGLQVYANPIDANTISIAWGSSSSLSGSGALLKLQFTALQVGSGTLEMDNFYYNATSINDLTDGTVTVEEAESFTLSLNEGWNLVGVPFNCAVDDERISVIWKYQQEWTTPEQLEVGFGYWIKVSQAFELELISQ